ncbi:MAG: adenine deaminase [Anaerolineales bacterium]|nr:MAG: adenine deaminase [Anaerolineales bacterium]
MKDAAYWDHTSQQLVDVAMGRTPADLVIRNGRWVCVQSGEIIPGSSIAIKGQRIAFVGPDASHTFGDATQVIDAEDRYLIPGLLDGHMHIESGMLTITEFVRAVLPRGTTGMFVDPHEIANIFGLKGVRLMVDEAAVQPIHIWVQVPSCVPSAPGLETPGAVMGPEEVAEAMTWPGIIGLGEMMNFPGVASNDVKMHAEMGVTRAAGKVIGGHYAAADLGLPFHGYAAGGPEDDHEGTRVEDAVARIRQGMKVMMRYGSAWHDVAAQVRAITENGLDPRHFMLVTDDSHSGTLVNEGHMDRVVRRTLELGVDPMTVIQMATLNTAEHFGVARDVGQIAPGRYADILIVEDFERFHIASVVAKGQVVAESGELKIELEAFEYPEEVKSSIHLGKVLNAKDFKLSSPFEGMVIANVIGVIENQAPTRHLRIELEADDGEIKLDPQSDLAKVALVERHQGTGAIQVGLVQGFGLNVGCAFASSVAHDSHHMVVVGTDEDDMALAANRLAQVGGGQIVVKGGEVLAIVELPIAGLMSNELAQVVAGKAEAVLRAFKQCGCQLNNANMQLSLLALVVIPSLRISDQGLVDVERFKLIPFIEPAESER